MFNMLGRRAYEHSPTQKFKLERYLTVITSQNREDKKNKSGLKGMVTLCSSERDRRFGRAYLPTSDRKLSQTRKQHKQAAS
jgi:hypothetical protein